MSTCVRFAPSPTGYLHVGGARTALFNWLFARSTGGRFLLRIEDTDTERNRAELADVILELLGWLGIEADEKPVFQSDNRDRHREAAERLLREGKAYLCDADNNEVAGTELADGLAVRFRVASCEQEIVAIQDAVRGEVSFATAEMEDFVLWRSNSTPTFLLANAIDDIDMGITHAIRGEDLLPSTPKAMMVMNALGADAPAYAHLPLLVNEQRKKLSKRRDDVSLENWRERGYLPEAMANYLATLGWGPPDDIEIRPMAEILGLFKLEDVLKSPAFFDPKKLEHFNATHIRQLSGEEFMAHLEPWFAKAAWPAQRYRPEVMDAIGPMVQEKIRTLADAERFVDWLMLEDPLVDADAWDKAIARNEKAAGILRSAIEAYETAAWEKDSLYDATLKLSEAHGLKLGKAQAPIRAAVSGRSVGPPLFESLVLLSREETLRRLRLALSKAESQISG